MSGQSGSLTDSPMEEQVYKLGLAAIGLGSSTATASPRVVVGPPESIYIYSVHLALVFAAIPVTMVVMAEVIYIYIYVYI